MNDQPTPPMPDAGGDGFPPPVAPATAPRAEAPTPRQAAGRTRQIAALAAVAAGVAITAGIAVAAGDDSTGTTEAVAATSDIATSDAGSTTAGALPSLDSDVATQPGAQGEMPDLGAVPDDGAMPDLGAFPGDMPMREGGRGHGPRGQSGEFGEMPDFDGDVDVDGQFGEMPTFDQSGGDATTATPGQMPQGGAPDASSQGS